LIEIADAAAMLILMMPHYDTPFTLLAPAAALRICLLRAATV